MSKTSIKCLMIGQAGIGKTTFLNQFPNCVNHAIQPEENKSLIKEIFSFETLNNKFENLTIEIQNCDITLETCLTDTDLIVNNKIIPSNHFINISNFNCIILCFAMDDPNSFELIKSKWEIDLKRNKNKQNSFILLGLKSDLSNKTYDGEELKSRKNVSIARNSFKKRSCSVNSTSSTSKLAKRNKTEILENDSDQKNSLSSYKKFSKLIGSMDFVQYSSFNDNLNYAKSKNPLNSYEMLIRNILSKYNTKNPNTNVSVNKKIIPKSISAPISNLVSRKSRKEKMDLRPLNSVHFENKSILHLNEENITMPVIKSVKTTEPISIKSKLSRLAIGLGTYIVTCGSNQSRRLADFKKMSNNKQKSIKKNKSWLLLASEMSLNNLENE
ncbi:unnamed protein product [Brachionus calyciflorus]|uniref:Uncharacterized protein n=1 Tax=Brachionus calyciflorus TaxID=104777 RepID=A0A814MQ28_9BILA|nr:unnamed protein product [Brachionus calyciflorus]